MISFDPSLLTSYYNSKLGLSSGTGTDSGNSALAAATKTYSPTGATVAPKAPWAYGSSTPQEGDLATKVLGGQHFINPNAIVSNITGASPDYTKLFTLYQGLNALEGLAVKAQDKHTSDIAMAAIKRRFAAGMSEVGSYISDTKFDHVSLTEGTLTQELKNTVGVSRTDTTYTAPAIHTGTADSSVKAFEGDVKFAISVKKIGTATPFAVDIDLSQMGTQTRSMSNVVSFINTKLKEQGLQSKFVVNRTPAVASTMVVGGKTITTSKGVDSYGLQIKGVTTESLTFSAPSTADAVFVVQTTGDPDKKVTTRDPKDKTKTVTTTGAGVSSQLMKFQTDVTASGTALDPAISKVGDKYWAAGESEQEAMPDTVKNVRQTVAGPDGSVYVLADVEGPTSGQDIKGSQDVALMKYDSAGKIVFTRTLGAADTASGYNMAVSSDGKVAITGSVTGALDISKTTSKTIGTGVNATTTTSTETTNLNGVDNATTDSFVTVFDQTGVEQWTQRRGGALADEATSVAFGTDGSVYVGGRTMSQMTGATDKPQGGWDSYVMGFDATGKSTFTQQGGTAQTDATSQMAVSGTTLYVASIENNEAVLKSYDVSSGKPVLAASRNLGGIGGGNISGLQVDNGKVYIGGSSGSGNMLSPGAVTHAYSGAYDAFAMSVDSDLTKTAADKIAYYGGTGVEKNAVVQFSNGKAWISGQTTGDITGTTKLQKDDAFLARVDIDTGTTEFQTRYTGTDGVVTPTAIAVAKGSSSVLDRLGLPQGKIMTTDSNLLTSGTSVRVGDQFSVVDPGNGSKKTITIEATDTMDSLAKKIVRASGYKLKVDVSKVLGKQLNQLDIKPSNSSSKVEFVAGAAGKDALAGLGLDAGLVSSDASKAVDASTSNYLKTQKPMGLSFDPALNLNSDANIKSAMDALQATMKNVQKVYNYLKYGDPQDTGPHKKSSASTTPPKYLTDQIANYQAALSRLTGGA